METIDRIITQLKNWEEEYTNAKQEYNQFVTDYKDSHPEFAEKLEKAWKETNDTFWGIEVNFRKAFKEASQHKEPQRSLDRHHAKIIRKYARSKEIRKYETFKDNLIKEAVKHDDQTTEIPERFKKLKRRYRKAKMQKANLNKTMKKFLNSKIFKEKYASESSDFELSF